MRRTIMLGAVVAIVAAACSTQTDPATSNTTITVPPRPGPGTELVAFDRCDALLDWVIDEAIDLVGPYGFEYGYGVYPVSGGVRLMDGALVAEDAAAPTSIAAAGGFTSTNLQEAGVDEPDLVKTDGKRIIVVSGQRLHVLTIDGGRLTLQGSVDLEFWSEQLFLVGDRVTVVSNQWGHPVPFAELDVVGDAIAPYPQQPIVTVSEIDISDPSDPELTRTLQVDGRFVSARLVSGNVRIVVSAAPTGFAWEYPEGGGLRAEREAEQANRQLVLDSTIENWVPYFVLTDHNGRDRVVTEGALVDCTRVHHPREFSGLTTLSLVTLTPSGLDVADATAVFADGEILYSSADATYVGTTEWTDSRVWEDAGAPQDVVTKIHRFRLFPTAAEYTASGEVPGFMLNQWSMSEHDGSLRVATTTRPEWWGGDDSESMVTVLAIDGTELTVVGTVDDLGRGERIYSVRFLGDVGYVVTFRQVDPLYVLDLSDPRSPSVSGELKIPGYSAYLHPITEGSLLGIGQDADTTGRTQGTQVSLFDVSDPTDPARIDRYTLDNTQSEVEWDHHAFLYEPRTETAVVPLTRWWVEDKGEAYGGVALVLDVDGTEIAERGTVRHGDGGDGWYPQIRRSLIIDSVLVTVSEAGVMTSDLTDLTEIDFASF